MSAHTAKEYAAFFKNVDAMMDALEKAGKEFDYSDILRLAAEQLPRATPPELAAKMAAHLLDMTALADEEDQQTAELEADMEMVKDFPSGTSFGDAVRTLAAAGHPRALTYVGHWNDPLHHARMALLEAAVDAHPAWRREGSAFVQDPDMDGPADDVSLVDWFQRTHPREAAAIEARFSGDRGGT